MTQKPLTPHRLKKLKSVVKKTAKAASKIGWLPSLGGQVTAGHIVIELESVIKENLPLLLEIAQSYLEQAEKLRIAVEAIEKMEEASSASGTSEGRYLAEVASTALSQIRSQPTS